MTGIDAKIPLAGVIGAPIAHSRSPQMHGHWLKTSGIKGFYIPMHVVAADLKQVLEVLPKMGYVGANVTLPHKEAVLHLASQVTDRARMIRAANTLTFQEDGTFIADNTDAYGFMENLRAGAPDWVPSHGPAAVIGAGGAARAVIVALLEAGVPQIRLSNRTRARADQLRADFGDKVAVVDWADAEAMIEGAAVVVNTTSLGMTGKPEMDVSLQALHRDSIVTDLVYTPLRTRFLDQAAQKGCLTVDGLGMLLHQGVPGFERWFGARPVVDEATRRAVLA